MIPIILGNTCSLIAMAIDSISSSRKTAREVLLVQALGQVFYGLAATFLKGYSAVVQNVISILRNLTAIREKESKYIEWILIVLAVALGIAFNNLGIIGLFPVIANLEYSLAILKFKDNERALKIAFAINIAMFTVFNAVIWNIVGLISNIVVVATTVTFLVKTRKK